MRNRSRLRGSGVREQGRTRVVPRPVVPFLFAVSLAGCAVPPAGTLYVTSGFEDRVYVLDAATGAVLDTITADRRPGEIDEPHGVSVSPLGSHWYVTLSHGDPSLLKFETLSDRLVGRVTLPQSGASRIGISPDGARGAVPDYFRAGEGRASKVTLVSLTDLEVLATAEPCEAPHEASFAPDGLTIAVTCSRSDEVTILDATTLDVVRRFPFGPGTRPMNLVWTPDGHRILVTLMGVDEIASLDLEEGAGSERPPGGGTARKQDGAPTGGSPAQIAITPDGALVATANRKARSVSLFDASTLAERRRIAVPGEHPHGATFDHSGEVLFVTYEGTTTASGGVVAYDRSGDLLWHTAVGIFTLGIAYRAPSP